MITACCNCWRIKNDTGEWINVDLDPETPNISHGICPDCIRELYPEFADELLKEKI